MEHTSKPGEEKRPYHSQVRQRQAEETRRCILAAVRELFESRGYAVTTLETIAEIADVSPKTIAAVFGSKRALVFFYPLVQNFIPAVYIQAFTWLPLFVGSIPAALATLKRRDEEPIIPAHEGQTAAP